MERFDPNRIVVRNAHLIGGLYVEGGSDTLDVKPPSDGVSYAGLPVADANVVDLAVQDARCAFKNSTGRAVRRASVRASCGAGPT